MYKNNIEERNPTPHNRRPITAYISFTALAVAAYFPMWSFMMALKNDALTLSYPLFHFFSDQLRSGSVPWWHFNIHSGFPLHADPGFPFWSPITWLCALAGSSLYVYTALILFYILAAGFGVTRLLKTLNLSDTVQWTGAVAYVLCGFFVSHLQHPHYIFEVAFIPFCINYFLRLCEQPNLSTGVKFGICLFFLVTSGYPSFTISATYFFFLLLVLNFLFDKNLRYRAHCRSLFFHLSIAILLALLLCLPYLCSLMELYPRFNRGGPLEEVKTIIGGITLKSFISLLFPLATVIHPEFYKTDISWNNIYFGGVTLALCIYGIFKVHHRFKTPLLIAGSALLLLSFQGFIKLLFFRYIPLFDHIRTNGALRIYFILCMIVVSMMALDAVLRSANIRVARKICIILLAVFTLAAVWTYFTGGLPDFSRPLALILKSLSIGNAILLQSILSILVLGLGYIFLKNVKWLWLIIYTEAACAFLISLPYTGLGTTPTRVVQQHLDSILYTTRSIPSQIPFSYKGEDKFFRDTILFSPAIGIMQPGSYPSGLSSYFAFVSKAGDQMMKNMKTVSCIHVHDSNFDHMHVVDIKPTGNSIVIKGNVDIDDTLFIMQNNYPGWKYQSTSENGKPKSMFGTFMAFPVKQGVVDVQLTYSPTGIVYCFIPSTFAWIFCCIILLRKRHRNVYRNS